MGPLISQAQWDRVQGYIQKGIDDGMTIEQLQAAGMSDQWQGWGGGFINDAFWIQTVHRSLTQ